MSKYLKILVEEIHSATIATLGDDGHPQTRIIDLMLWDEKGIYFLTAKGKVFYDQLMEQKFVAISATKDQQAVSLRGWVRNIGSEKREEIFEKNPYMQKIYPEHTREALEVFHLYQAQGEYFDIRNPEKIVRAGILIGEAEEKVTGYVVGEACIGCGQCLSVCPQSCIDISKTPVEIKQNQCLHCGQCVTACPVGAIERRR